MPCGLCFGAGLKAVFASNARGLSQLLLRDWRLDQGGFRGFRSVGARSLTWRETCNVLKNKGKLRISSLGCGAGAARWSSMPRPECRRGTAVLPPAAGARRRALRGLCPEFCTSVIRSVTTFAKNGVTETRNGFVIAAVQKCIWRQWKKSICTIGLRPLGAKQKVDDQNGYRRKNRWSQASFRRAFGMCTGRCGWGR